ncbi:MAG TPA: PTS galactitol transporter subunit IIC [Candidatus Korarchaeota archaeon]|nr:PTS galactitol transporter subunit IIC [Candidatus Korarchaeota archaeon]
MPFSIAELVQTILGFGPALMMPIILFILGVAFKQPIGKSLRSAVTVGVAFIGIFAVLGAVFGVLGPAVETMVERTGIQLEGMDIGWPLTSAITWASKTAPLIIPIGFAVNVVLLAIGLTKTFDADLWNYWHWAFTAVMVEFATGSTALGLIAAVITEIVILLLADWTVPTAQTFFGIPGASLPHTETVNWAPYAFAIDKVLRKVPGLEKIKADPESIRAKLGFFGEPMMLGVYVGLFLGALARLPISKIYELAIYTGALLLLEGRMIGILMEGLMPIADGIREFFAKSERFKGREIYIGIDAGPVGLASPGAVAVGLLLIPLYILLTFMPGNRILPLADLAIIPVFVMWSVAAAGGNLIRGLINGAIVSVLVVYITNDFGGPLTAAGKAIGYEMPAGATVVSSLDAGSHVFPWIVMMIFIRAGEGNMKGLLLPLIAGILYFACWYWTRDMPKQVAKELEEA